MTDEAKLRQQHDRGHRAKQLLENPLFQEAFDTIENTITEAWKHTGADEEDARRNAYLMQRLLRDLRQHFVSALSTGKVAEKKLLQTQDKSKIRRILNV